MLEEFSLDEVAEAYFSVRTPDQLEYAQLLIRAREKAVFPLLRALLVQAIKQKKVFGDLGQELGMTNSDTGLAEYLYVKSTFEPDVKKAYDVIRRIGEPAKAELCRALLERDNKVSLAAALLLSMDDHLSKETENSVKKALGYIRSDHYEDIVSMLLGIVLARAGDAKWREIIENDVRSYGLSIDEWIEQTANMALIELQRSG